MMRSRDCHAPYQYSALILVYRQIQDLSPRSSEVQHSVCEIPKGITSILPMTTLWPWVLLTTLIYTAGQVHSSVKPTV